MSALLTPNA
jgi:hypothetical protein